MTDNFNNHFLISLPALKEDYFQDTVSLIIEHDEEGAFGLVINQPLDIEVADLFPNVPTHTFLPIMEGGPVDPERVFFLHPTGPTYASTLELSNEIALTTSDDFIQAIIDGTAPAKSMIILGYAGWGGHQLESEIGKNIWLLAPAKGSIVFDLAYEARAREAAAILGVDLNLISPAGHD